MLSQNCGMDIPKDGYIYTYITHHRLLYEDIFTTNLHLPMRVYDHMGV